MYTYKYIDVPHTNFPRLNINRTNRHIAPIHLFNETENGSFRGHAKCTRARNMRQLAKHITYTRILSIRLVAAGRGRGYTVCEYGSYCQECLLFKYRQSCKCEWELVRGWRSMLVIVHRVGEYNLIFILWLTTLTTWNAPSTITRYILCNACCMVPHTKSNSLVKSKSHLHTSSLYIYGLYHNFLVPSH